MQVHGKGSSAPAVTPSPPHPGPEVFQPAAQGRRRRGVWHLVAVILLIAAGLYWKLGPAGETPGTGTSAVAALRTAKLEVRDLQQTIRLAGTTSAEKYANLMPPRLSGSRSGRGRGGGSSSTFSAGGSSNITVASTSSVARSSSSASLSSTGATSLASTGNTSGGGFSGSPRSASSALQAATSRVGTGSSSGSSGGSNISSSSQSSSSAVGSSGTGSTSSSLMGGSSGPPSGGGGGRGRGDFHMALQWLIEPGSMVKKGDPVAEFDRQYMLNRLDDYKSSVIQIEARQDKLEADLDVSRYAHEQSIRGAKGDLDKAELDTKATPVLSAIDSERLRLAHEEAEARYQQLLGEVKYVRISEQAQLRNAELEVEESQVELRRVELNADRMVLRAPIDGMIVLLNVFRSGEFTPVREGDELHSGQPFMQVVDNSSMVIDSTVSQVDVEKMRIGMKARVRFDAFPDLELPARVYSIGSVAKSRQFRQEYVKDVPVRLKLEKLDPRVIPDLSVSADVILETEQQVTVVPLEAVSTDPDSEQTYVSAQGPSGWERRSVELGLRNNVAAAVRAGLQAGDVVALERRPAGTARE